MICVKIFGPPLVTWFLKFQEREYLEYKIDVFLSVIYH